MSDRYQFTVIMPNLNYDVPQDQMDAQIIKLISNDNKVTTEKIAMTIGVSTKTVKRHIKKMGNIQYVGSGFSGHWKIKE